MNRGFNVTLAPERNAEPWAAAVHLHFLQNRVFGYHSSVLDSGASCKHFFRL